MSALRLGRKPDGTRDVRVIDDGASPRIDRARSGISFTPLTEAIRPFTGMRNLEVRAKPGSKPRAMTIKRRGGKTCQQPSARDGATAPSPATGTGADSGGVSGPSDTAVAADSRSPRRSVQVDAKGAA